jgi:hypothetical protein
MIAASANGNIVCVGVREGGGVSVGVLVIVGGRVAVGVEVAVPVGAMVILGLTCTPVWVLTTLLLAGRLALHATSENIINIETGQIRFIANLPVGS